VKNWTSCLSIFEGFDWSHENEQLIERFGSLDNGKLNLIHEKSLRKHGKLVRMFQEMHGDPVEDSEATA